MQTYQYRVGAFDCLVANKEKLGITEELVSQILRELSDKHSIEDWETEWLTYTDRWFYFELKCIDEGQKMKLWTLVEDKSTRKLAMRTLLVVDSLLIKE